MNERAKCDAATVAERERHEKYERPGRRNLAEVVMPERRRDQRKYRDRQQHARERQPPQRRQSCAVERGGRRKLRPAGQRQCSREPHASTNGTSFHRIEVLVIARSRASEQASRCTAEPRLPLRRPARRSHAPDKAHARRARWSVRYLRYAKAQRRN